MSWPFRYALGQISLYKKWTEIVKLASEKTIG